MAFIFGNNKAGELYYGGQKIAKVYAGSKQIFSTNKQNWQNRRAFDSLVLVDGKLGKYIMPDARLSHVTLDRITEYDDWRDIGLRSDGSLYWVEETDTGANVTQIGTATGWSAIRGGTALRHGKVYAISTGAAVQTGGGYSDYTRLLSENYAIRADGCIYAVASGQCLTPGISGGWYSFDDCSGNAVVLRDGVMYRTPGISQEFAQYGGNTTWKMASLFTPSYEVEPCGINEFGWNYDHSGSGISWQQVGTVHHSWDMFGVSWFGGLLYERSSSGLIAAVADVAVADYIVTTRRMIFFRPSEVDYGCYYCLTPGGTGTGGVTMRYGLASLSVR